MTWAIRTDRDFDRALKTLDRQVARRVLKTLTALENLDDPTTRCEALSGPYAGLWRLRVGDYRVILDIRRAELIIIALDMGNYERRVRPKREPLRRR
ncbi:MAG: type II toxin-antitoxin system RelE/ParE family toxin [Micrococcales bacterium]|nr:type II toxin-antitoxin system RelE/ParE family toxin [Micrococcales bacterium]